MNHTNAVLAVCAALLGPLMFGLSLGFTGPAIDTMQNNVFNSDEIQIQMGEDSNLWVFKTSTEASLFSSLVTIGAMIGALFGGPVTQKFGRKWTLFGCSPLYALCWLWMALADSPWQLITARVFNGIAVGVCSFVAPTYIGEVSPVSLRGMLGAGNQLAITIGILLAYLLGLAFRSQAESVDPLADADTFCNWRALCWLYLIPSCLLGICVVFVPESPRWLADQGKVEQAKKNLCRLRGVTDTDVDIQEELRSLEGAAHTQAANTGSAWKNLSQCKKQLFIGIMLQILQQFSGINAVIFYQTSIFQAAGLDNKETMSLTVMIVQVVVTVIACAIMDKAGRRILLISGAAGMCISAICMGTFFYIKEDSADAAVGWLAIVSAYGYIASFSIGVGAIPWLIMAEIFPDEVRGLAASLATTVNWLCGFIITMFLDDFKNAVSFVGVFWIFAAVCAFMIGFVIMMVPETKGKTFEEIQKIFNKEKTSK